MALAQRSVPGDDVTWLTSLRRNKPDWPELLASLAALYVRGARIDWAGFDRPYAPGCVELPTYPFERKSKSSGSLEFGADALREGCHLAIFPEGKRDDGRFLGFTPGFAKIAYQTGAPVVPIRIDGAHKAMPRNADTIGRHPMKVEFKEPLEADRSVPYERRQEAYARLVAEANAAVSA